MRGYFLTNMYLSPIQCGIQSAHCIHDMFVHHQDDFVGGEQAAVRLFDWAENHKTMIVLNGGTSDDLDMFLKFLSINDHTYPYGHFLEPGIGDALTCVGIILDEPMIEAISWIRQGQPEGGTAFHYSEFEMELARQLATKPLA